MELYDVNTELIIRFVERYGCPNEAVANHRRCYAALRAYLVKQGGRYTPALAAQWMDSILGKYCTAYYRYFRKCILQLNDIYETGEIREEHFPIISAKYSMDLFLPLKKMLDDYISSCKDRYSDAYIDSIRVRCSKFLMFIQKCGVTDISRVTYKLLADFQEEGCYKDRVNKSACVSSVYPFLLHLAGSGKCTYGLAWYLYYARQGKALYLESFPDAQKALVRRTRSESLDFPSDEFYGLIPEFIKILEGHGYSYSVTGVSRDTLMRLYLFLDMHGLGYHPDIARAWFDVGRPTDRVYASSIYRVLLLFREFTTDGSITPEQVFTEKEFMPDRIPEWCKEPLSGFIALKKKEQKAGNTIRMCRTANTRFCLFLGEKGLGSFAGLTPEHVREFNLKDRHRTAESKNAYNIKIRQFLIYLAERELLSNSKLYMSITCRAAPTERIVVTFTDKEIADILKFNASAETPLDLRKRAMLLMGLRMGLRAIDIVNLKLTDIDWKKASIRLIQKKTRTEVCLPMPVDVGNAVYKYLMNGRPETGGGYVFVRHTAPYGKLSSGACRNALKSALPDRDVPGSGFHAARKTFSTNLLKKGVGASVIADVLGHGDNQSISRYLSLDKERMDICPLSLADIGIPTERGTGHA